MPSQCSGQGVMGSDYLHVFTVSGCSFPTQSCPVSYSSSLTLLSPESYLIPPPSTRSASTFTLSSSSALSATSDTGSSSFMID
jgi:hypothetical protein